MKVPLQYIDRLIRAEKIALVAIKGGLFPKYMGFSDPPTKDNIEAVISIMAGQICDDNRYPDVMDDVFDELEKAFPEAEMHDDFMIGVFALPLLPNPFVGLPKSWRPTKARAAELMQEITTHHYADLAGSPTA